MCDEEENHLLFSGKGYWMKYSAHSLLAAAVLMSVTMGGCESTATSKSAEEKTVAPAPAAPATPVAAAKPVAAPAAAPVAAPAAKPAAPVFADYGAAIKGAEGSEAVPVAKVLAAPADYNNKVVRISGKVIATCDHKGCWFTLGDSAANDVIFIKFKDPAEGRIIPLEAPGHDAILEGEFVIGKMSEKFARHLKEEAGASEEELEKIVGPQKVYTVKNVAVRIYGVKPADQNSKQ